MESILKQLESRLSQFDAIASILRAKQGTMRVPLIVSLNPIGRQE
jgi:hypothetical protein